eukprot:scaffold168431_cov30-Tisochrysis_lutea.AAC.4
MVFNEPWPRRAAPHPVKFRAPLPSLPRPPPPPPRGRVARAATTGRTAQRRGAPRCATPLTLTRGRSDTTLAGFLPCAFAGLFTHQRQGGCADRALSGALAAGAEQAEGMWAPDFPVLRLLERRREEI